MVLKKVKSTRYTVIKTLEQVKQLASHCKTTRYCSYDFETRAEGPHGIAYGDDEDKKLPCGPQYKEDEPTCLSVSFQPYSSWVIPLFHFESPFTREEVLWIFQYFSEKVFEDRSIVKVGYNLKFEARWLIRYNCTMKGVCIDVMLCKYLLYEERPNDLKSLTAEKIPRYANYESEIVFLVRKYKGWANIPLKPLAKYNAIDSDVTLRLLLLLEPKVIKSGFYKLLRNMCMPQTKVLAESESMGMNVDRQYLKDIIRNTKREIDILHGKLVGHKKVKRFQRWRIEQKIKKLIRDTKKEIEDIRTGKMPYTFPDRAIKNREQKVSKYIAGNLTTKKERVDDFNPASPNQLVDFLYLAPGGLGLPIVKYTKDKETKRPTDRPSTDEEALLLLQAKKKDKSGFIQTLLEYRTITKLYSTYMVAMEYRLTPEDRIHGSFLIHGTVTGRLSSKNPNLQNIPRDTTSKLIKKMFVTPPGHVLVEVDYGQAELRVVAELSGCKGLIEIFEKGYNVHLATGLKIIHEFERYDEIKKLLKDFDHPDHDKWEKIKKKGKVLNFSILYLQSDEMTANQMGCDIEEAIELKAEWFEAFHEIKDWMEGQEEFLKEHGFVYNIFGRKRRLPDIYSPEKGRRNKAIRDCINAPIQGGSSDFTQLATIVMREQILKQDLILTDDIRYISQAYTVHDSIGFYVMPKYIHEAIPKLVKICSDPETMKYFGFEMTKVRMKASPEVGANWGDLKDYDPHMDYTKLLTI